MPPLPAVQTLREAVLAVINQPQSGSPATRFISATQYGNATNLAQVIRSLINDPATLQYLEREPHLHTIEDFVCLHGQSWGFDQMTAQNACARVAHFNQLAPGRLS